MTQGSVHEEGTRPEAGRPTRGRDTGGGRDEDGRGTSGRREPPGGDGRRPAPRRGGRRHRALRWAATTLAVLILGTSGAGYLYYEHLNGNLEKGERSSGDSNAHRTEPNAAGQTPLNILLIGSDSRASDANVALGGGRNHRDSPPLGDVQMLIHLAAGRKSAAVVSIPRDTRVDIPACKDPGTGEKFPATNAIINESLARGGPGCTLATWENLTGVYVDHWMTIDFAGVVSMADAVGGVEVCVNQNVWDRPLPGVPGGSGLKLTAGSHKVQGEEALQWLRTRHAWGSDPLRARAQHMYMNSMVRTLKQQNVFADTGRLMGLAEAATKSLKVSEEIGTVKRLYDLGMQLKTVPTDRITMTTIPTVQDDRDANHLLPAAGADTMWAMLRDDVAFDDEGGANGKGSANNEDSKDGEDGEDGEDGKDAGDRGEDAGGRGEDAGEQPTDEPAADADMDVVVQNATRSATLGPVTGRAGAVAGTLVKKGFTGTRTDASAARAEERTTVRYPSDDLAGDARRVAEALGIPASSVRRSTDVSGITLAVGADWRSGTSYPEQGTPGAGDLPDDSDALNGSETDTCMEVYQPYRW
ncbi:LCP family protein [Streptomyces sp. enrichment culture]|uniref:LCP family protein n=1 Tax=Streptomyces sp. enrichment culture TaxID=1795815 RepID=UPI003F5580A3